MKKILILLAFMILVPSLALALENTSITQYNPSTTVYYNETCPIDSTCVDVRVLVDIINISINTTRLYVPFSIYGADSKLLCNLMTEDKVSTVHCSWDAPGSIWPDMLFNKPVPLPSDELARVETYWNTTNIQCQRDSAFKSSVIIYGTIIILISVCSLWLYMRWKKYGMKSR